VEGSFRGGLDIDSGNETKKEVWEKGEKGGIILLY